MLQNNLVLTELWSPPPPGTCNRNLWQLENAKVDFGGLSRIEKAWFQSISAYKSPTKRPVTHRDLRLVDAKSSDAKSTSRCHGWRKVYPKAQGRREVKSPYLSDAGWLDSVDGDAKFKWDWRWPCYHMSHTCHIHLRYSTEVPRKLYQGSGHSKLNTILPI